MDDTRLQKQVEQVDRTFHRLWFGILIGQSTFFSEQMEKLTFFDMHVIGIAYNRPDAILKEIREYLKVPQTTLSSIISRLEKRGYIRRVINHRDMRSFSLEVTDLGKKVLEEHKRLDREQARNVLISLDEEERDMFIRLLEKVASNVGASRFIE